jgi:hemoglobin
MTEQVRHDILGDEDIQTLVHQFYSLVQKDELLRPIFEDVAKVDWAEHLPHLCRFWSDLLFRTRTFTGQPWPKHAVLPLKRKHFERWIALFVETLNVNFAGAKTEEAKGFALSIADSFQLRLGLLPWQQDPAKT